MYYIISYSKVQNNNKKKTRTMVFLVNTSDLYFIMNVSDTAFIQMIWSIPILISILFSVQILPGHREKSKLQKIIRL